MHKGNANQKLLSMDPLTDFSLTLKGNKRSQQKIKYQAKGIGNPPK